MPQKDEQSNDMVVQADTSQEGEELSPNIERPAQLIASAIDDFEETVSANEISQRGSSSMRLTLLNQR